MAVRISRCAEYELLKRDWCPLQQCVRQPRLTSLNCGEHKPHDSNMHNESNRACEGASKKADNHKWQPPKTNKRATPQSSNAYANKCSNETPAATSVEQKPTPSTTSDQPTHSQTQQTQTTPTTSESSADHATHASEPDTPTPKPVDDSNPNT
jgi:hypothetical protein